MSKKTIYEILLCVFSIIMIVSVVWLAKYYYGSHIADKNQKQAFEWIQQTEQSETDETAPKTLSLGDKKEKYEELLSRYPEFSGWIMIPETKIDYPVMQKIGEGTDYFYLDHDYTGAESSSGSIFINENCDLSIPSDNIVIYGHNMKSGTMFHDLLKYKDASFYEDNPYITFNSVYQDGLYIVIAAFYTRVDDSKPASDEYFHYYEYIDMETQEEFDEFYTTCKRLSLYDAEEAFYGDELITLSTCSYQTDDGSERFVVVAKKIDV